MTTVAVGYVHDPAADLSWSWHDSFEHMAGWHGQQYGHPEVPELVAKLPMSCGTDGLEAARNRVVSEFLDLPSRPDYLFWIDCDMGFPPTIVADLASVAHPTERPVVGALCFRAQKKHPDGYGGWTVEVQPTVFDWGTVGGKSGFIPRLSYKRDTVTQVAATGSAAVLIHRSVFETIEAEHGQRWYDKLTVDGLTYAEDLSFCMRVGAADIPMFVHTGVLTTHIKSVWLSEQHFLDQQFPPPARERVAVIAPVMRRPQNVERFVVSLRASSGLAVPYFVCDEDDHDEIAAVRNAGAEVIVNKGSRGFAVKANLGYRETSEAWMLFVGDDVMFRPGWYDRALRAAGDRFGLVSTNDRGNVAVMTGVHATHPLMRRSWVDESGASWDGPGTVAHEGYRHWYVDNEWTAKSQQEGQFVYAPDAVVEHFHPLFNKATTDETYRLGQSYADRDRKLWEKRAEAHVWS